MPPISEVSSVGIDSTVGALQRLAEARDHEAWGLIVELHGQRLFQSAVRITGDRELAEDACQEAFLLIRDSAGKFQPIGSDHEAAAIAWIQRIAATCALKQLRSRRRRRHHEQEAGRARPESRDHSRLDNLEVALRAEMAQLPEAHRLPLILHYFSGLDYSSIANEVGCSVGNARVRVHRALERLRSRLARAGTAVTAGALATKLGAIESELIMPSAQVSAKWTALLQSPAIASTSLGAVGGTMGFGVAAKASLSAATVIVCLAGVAASGGTVSTSAAAVPLSAKAAPAEIQPLPEGLAALYPGDRNIASDPHVLFTENFESGRLEDIVMRWGSGGGEAMRLDTERSAASRGGQSLAITLPRAPSENPQWRFGPHLFTHTRGVDRMHVRFYVKLHERHGCASTLFRIEAERQPTRWPNGAEGERPDGALRFFSVVGMCDDFARASKPGAMRFYSYWHDMPEDGRGQYWGKDFVSKSDPILRNRWVCVEAMIQANSSPELSDGAQTMWIDGRQVAEFTGIRWRTSDELKLNSVWLLYGVNTPAIAANAEAGLVEHNEARFDDIVVADQYIGPISGK
jgi:RNA polymerase sigma-70 factor (ECF subfamily)